MNDRRQWFKDRIGKRVFRNRNGCSCSVCEGVYQNGSIVDDEYWNYDCETEGEYNADGFPLQYFDTKEEAIQFTTQNASQLMSIFWQGIKDEYKGRDLALVDLYNHLNKLVQEKDFISLNYFLIFATGDTDTDRLTHIANVLRPAKDNLTQWQQFHSEAIKICAHIPS